MDKDELISALEVFSNIMNNKAKKELEACPKDKPATLWLKDATSFASLRESADSFKDAVKASTCILPKFIIPENTEEDAA